MWRSTVMEIFVLLFSISSISSRSFNVLPRASESAFHCHSKSVPTFGGLGSESGYRYKLPQYSSQARRFLSVKPETTLKEMGINNLDKFRFVTIATFTNNSRNMLTPDQKNDNPLRFHNQERTNLMKTPNTYAPKKLSPGLNFHDEIQGYNYEKPSNQLTLPNEPVNLPQPPQPPQDSFLLPSGFEDDSIEINLPWADNSGTRSTDRNIYEAQLPPGSQNQRQYTQGTYAGWNILMNPYKGDRRV